MTFSTIALQRAQDFWQGSFKHPFITQLQDGSLDEAVFRYYLLQDRYYLEHFSRIYKLVADQAGDSALGKMMIRNSKSLAEGELLIRQRFFKELGIGTEDIEKTPVAPTCYHYVSHIYRQLVEEENLAIVFASLLPCPWLYYDIGVELNKTGSPQPLYQSWIETYANDELKQQIDEELHLINEFYDAANPLEQEKMIEAFVISAKMEYAFWEMSYTFENWVWKDRQ